jgi:ParB family chromosome partitioning protein
LQKKGLGRGLGALLGDALGADDMANVRQVRVDQVRANPYQPRREFDEEKLAELTESVKEHGILQPILVRRLGVDRYELIAGERRFRAAQGASLSAVPAIVRDLDDRQMLEVALIENVQREDISALDAAAAYQRLAEEFGLTQEEIAQRVGKARTTVANTLRLLSLPEPVLEGLQAGRITEGHARALLQVAPEAQVKAYEKALRDHLTVRQTEELARNLGEARKGSTRTGARRKKVEEGADPNHAAVEEALQVALGTRVRIRREGGVGRLEIEFYSDEELEGLVDRIIGG